MTSGKSTGHGKPGMWGSTIGCGFGSSVRLGSRIRSVDTPSGLRVMPDVASSSAKAQRTLKNARTMPTVEPAEDAGRVAYPVGYHAAEAVVFERTGEATKTHKSMHP